MEHFMNEKEMEHKFIKLMEKYFRDREFNYKIVIEPNFSNYTDDVSIKNNRADIIILKDKFPYMIVDLRSKDISQYVDRKEIQNAIFEDTEIGADYHVFTNMSAVLVVDVIKKSVRYYDSFEDIFQFFDDRPQNEIDLQKKHLIEHIINTVNNSDLSISKDSYLGEGVKELLTESNLNKNIEFNSIGRFFHFHSNTELGLNDFEHRFFQSLLKPVVEQAVCRYTTFESLFSMLDNKTYRMGSDIAMNDRGEIDYVDKYIGLYYKNLQSLSLPELRQMNKSYISSCTTTRKLDDLTMYRLYGEDSKGVCLSFNVTNGLQSKSLLVKKVSYAIGPGNHPELDLIKNILYNHKSPAFIRFRFLYLDIWKHFFKTHDYAVEEEVRLLYLNNKSYPPKKEGWVVTYPDKILSKFVLFGLNDSNFPLRLSKIILGPNCPEALLNSRQLEVLLDENNLTNIQVENSKIVSYRKN